MWNSVTNPNGYSHCDCNRHANSHNDRERNSNGYSKTHSNPEIPSHTKATSDPIASSVTAHTA